MMMLNKKNKKKIILAFCIFFFLIIITLLPKNYKKEYKIDKYKIIEKYIKKDKMYVFQIYDKSNIYETISLDKYTSKRKLISKVKKYNENDTTCIIVNSKKINDNIICKKNKEYIDYHLTSFLPKKYYKKSESKKFEYKNIKLSLLDNNTYLIWNYKGFYKIKNKEHELVKIFNDDVYDINLSVIVDKYLIIADYNQKYNYNKLLRLNLENNKIEEIKLKEDISFESRILGSYKNYIYILDEKNKKEYEINIKNKNFSKISNGEYGKIYKNNKFEKIKINKIITHNISFDNDNKVSYELKNGLYKKFKNISQPIKISDKNIKKIVYYDDNEIYFIKDEFLYKYDFKNGITKVIDYFELNFNYNNMIFIYKN